MAGSLSNWLALREPADSAARSASLARKLASRIGDRTPLRIVDLGAGTGSNVRYLASRLPRPQHWLLVDRDPTLLEEARRTTVAADLVETCELDLGPLDVAGIFSGRDLITASALLDLVSEKWLRSLASHACVAGAAALFALTYDGRFDCSPPEPEDAIVRTLFNRHQRRSDKGFGVAAGPGATAYAERAFAAVGYHVQRENSDWILEADARDLQRALIAGWATAAGEMAPGRSALIADWLSRRVAHVDAGRSRITVGHQDLMAWKAHV
jgi:SAM-dependent methyltransferase